MAHPTGSSIGWLTRQVPLEEDDQGWVYVSPAHGTIVVPAEERLELEVDWANSVDLSALTTLGSDDLESIQFRDIRLPVEQLVYLQTLTGLQRLFFSKTAVTDAGLAYLQKLIDLRSLWLHDTQITNEGVIYLRGLIHLRELAFLDNPNINDRGLSYLYALGDLQTLLVSGTGVSKGGISTLRRMLPNCTVVV